MDELAGGELVAGGAGDIAERQGQLDDLGLADRRGDGRAVGVGDGVGRLGAGQLKSIGHYAASSQAVITWSVSTRIAQLSSRAFSDASCTSAS